MFFNLRSSIKQASLLMALLGMAVGFSGCSEDRGSIYSTPADVVVLVAGTQQLVITSVEDDLDPSSIVAASDLTFLSQNVGIATVSATGLVTGVGIGETAIIVTQVSTGLSTVVEVVVAEQTYTVSGTVVGDTAPGLILQLNGSDTTIVLANEPTFAFSDPVSSLLPYAVVVAQQPAGLTCLVTGGGAANDGTGPAGGAGSHTIVVTCAPSAFTISGTVSGLAAGNHLELTNLVTDEFVGILGTGAVVPYNFNLTIPTGGSFDVEFFNTFGHHCGFVPGGSNMGTNVMANVIIAIRCADFLTIAPPSLALVVGASSVPLVVRSQPDNVIRPTAELTFAPSSAAVTVDPVTAVVTAEDAIASVCGAVVTDGSADPIVVTDTVTGATGDVTPVVVSQATLGGTISGLTGVHQVTLQNPNTDIICVDSTGPIGNGAFTFSTGLNNNAAYDVTVSGQPVDQWCEVTGGTNIANDGTGTINAANDATIVVTCQNITGVAVTPSPINVSANALALNHTQQTTVTITLADASTVVLANNEPGLTYLSADPLTATVDANGLVTGVSAVASPTSLTATYGTMVSPAVVVNVAL
jgi:hypothetical protein